MLSSSSLVEFGSPLRETVEAKSLMEEPAQFVSGAADCLTDTNTTGRQMARTAYDATSIIVHWGLLDSGCGLKFQLITCDVIFENRYDAFGYSTGSQFAFSEFRIGVGGPID